MAKPTPIHVDRIGKPIELGDMVAVADYNGLMLGRVTKLNQKMIKVKRYPTGSRNYEKNKYPRESIKLDPDDVAIHILSGGD
jgi:hypothetical protein